MTIEVNIFDADGRTQTLFRTNSIEDAHQFLNLKDHEGSSIDMKIVVHGEEVYNLLRKLE